MGDVKSLSGVILPTDPTDTTEAVRKSYVDVLPSATTPNASWNGLTAWAYDPIAITNSYRPTSGVVQLTRVWLPVDAVVTTVYASLLVTGTTLTSGQNFLGLYSKTGTRLGVTADQTTSWATTGSKAVALTSSYTVTASDFHYVAILTNASTTPAFATGTLNSQPINTLGVSGTLRFAVAGTGQTSLPASLTPSAPGAGLGAFWAGTS